MWQDHFKTASSEGLTREAARLFIAIDRLKAEGKATRNADKKLSAVLDDLKLRPCETQLVVREIENRPASAGDVARLCKHFGRDRGDFTH